MDLVITVEEVGLRRGPCRRPARRSGAWAVFKEQGFFTKGGLWMNIIPFAVEDWERQAFEKPARGAPGREAFENQ